MMKRTHKYMMQYPSDEWQTVSMPSAFTAKDLAEKYQYCEIWQYIPKGFNIYVEQGAFSKGHVNGPCWVLYEPKINGFTRCLDVAPNKQFAEQS
jgi:hypothetical protein